MGSPNLMEILRLRRGLAPYPEGAAGPMPEGYNGPNFGPKAAGPQYQLPDWMSLDPRSGVTEKYDSRGEIQSQYAEPGTDFGEALAHGDPLPRSPGAKPYQIPGLGGDDFYGKAPSSIKMAPGDLKDPVEKNYVDRPVGSVVASQDTGSSHASVRPDRYKIIDEAYDQPTPSLDMYRNHVSAPPERTKPKWWEIGLGALAAGGQAYATNDVGAGIETGRNVMNYRHNLKLQDWGTKERGLKGAAEVEERTGANRMRKAGAVSRAVHDEKMEGQGDDKNEISRQELTRKYEADIARERNADRRAQIEQEYRRAMAATGQRNADTNARRAATDERKTDLLGGEYASRDRKRRQPVGSRQNPQNVSRAEWDATNEVLQENPQWRKMFGQENVDSGGNKRTVLGEYPEEAEKNTKVEWVRMKNEIRKRARKRLAGAVDQDEELTVDDPNDDEEDQ